MITLVKPNWTPIQNLSQKLFSKFTLQDIGSSLGLFSKLRLSYQNLPIDKAALFASRSSLHANLPPTRFRRYQNFEVQIVNPHQFRFLLNDSYQFTQNVQDARKEARVFSPMEPKVLDKDFYHLMGQMVALTLYHQPNIYRLSLSTHQVRLLSYPESHADNSPEGIHQDGADYIVSALVLNKHNIENGHSVIYDPQLEPIYKTQLDEGEFIFQDDKELWHDITPIKAKHSFLGYRDILGFDFKIIE